MQLVRVYYYYYYQPGPGPGGTYVAPQVISSRSINAAHDAPFHYDSPDLLSFSFSFSFTTNGLHTLIFGLIRLS